MSEFIALFQEAPEGGFTVTVPALPGCISEGDTFEEAEANIREAIELYLEVISEAEPNTPLSDTAGKTFTVPIKIRA